MKAFRNRQLQLVIPFVLLSAASAFAQNSVETQRATANFKPAFVGQTRIKAVKTTVPLTITVINSKLDRPWAISEMPDQRFLITQKGGTMVILDADGRLSKTITGLPKVDDSGQGGLLDVTLAPDFAKSRMLYWAYAEPQQKGVLLTIAKGRLAENETSIQNQVLIYRATPAYNGKLQYGSRIVFNKNGNLFVSTGERSGKDIRMQAQQLNSSLGKILHLTTSGKPVANGPFANQTDARPEIYAYGLRNPDGLAINPQTGELWEAEFGPRGGDEVNIIKPGKNYGWPVITYGTEYSGAKVGDGIQKQDGMEQPIYYWNPSISPGSIAFYNSSHIAEWKGNLFVAALGGSHLIRLVIKNNKIVGEERLLADKGERFRDLVQAKDGALYTVTDGGNLYKITKK